MASASASPELTAPLVSLLARLSNRNDLLPQLHQRAVECSGGLQATSGFGLEELRVDTWRPGASEASIVADAFGQQWPSYVPEADTRMPDLAARLGMPAALLPLVQGTRRLRLLAIGFTARNPASTDWTAARDSADAIVTALELFRLRRNEDLQHELRQLVDDVSANLTMTLDLRAGLDLFCARATPLLGADRTCVWLLD